MRGPLIGLVGVLSCLRGAESTLEIHQMYEKVHSWKRGPVPGPERAHPQPKGAHHRIEGAHYMPERVHFIPWRTHPRSRRAHYRLESVQSSERAHFSSASCFDTNQLKRPESALRDPLRLLQSSRGGGPLEPSQGPSEPSRGPQGLQEGPGPPGGAIAPEDPFATPLSTKGFLICGWA